MSDRAMESKVTLAVAGFLASCRSANTQAAYRTDLAHIGNWCREIGGVDLLSIDVADVARYRSACELAGASPATVARRLSAISSFSAFASTAGATPELGASPDLKRPTIPRLSSTERLSGEEAQALLDAADALGPRAAALIRLLMLDGLKVGEVVTANVADLSGRPPDVNLMVPGSKPRHLRLHVATGRTLRRYVGRRGHGPLLLSEQRGRTSARLTRFGVDYLIKKIAERAGIEQTPSANTLRRRYVMAAHADGITVDDIRDHAGHSERGTTRRYLTDRDTAVPVAGHVNQGYSLAPEGAEDGRTHGHR